MRLQCLEMLQVTFTEPCNLLEIKHTFWTNMVHHLPMAKKFQNLSTVSWRKTSSLSCFKPRVKKLSKSTEKIKVLPTWPVSIRLMNHQPKLKAWTWSTMSRKTIMIYMLLLKQKGLISWWKWALVKFHLQRISPNLPSSSLKVFSKSCLITVVINWKPPKNCWLLSVPKMELSIFSKEMEINWCWSMNKPVESKAAKILE